ncbi:MAG: YqcI/YcgG family protein [Pyrinomonadaceae bacterium]|nr:YqcI/YcgG family protein [Sphingobacteriaceae bacterium]
MTTDLTDNTIIGNYLDYIKNEDFPCIAAKAALGREQIKCLVADHIACPHDDQRILDFMYDFVDNYRNSTELYHSATIIFKGPENIDEQSFDRFLWMRLQAISNLDLVNYSYDDRVDSNPHSADFSFSLKEEAFFVIGMHPGSSRMTRQFQYPTLTFNPHAQFEQLRELNKFEKMQEVVRKRDLKYSGSVNPMLKDYGVASEVYQYSGRQYDENWKCPFKINNAKSDHNTAA